MQTATKGVFLFTLMAKREFTGVFIPACVWTCKELTPAEKMMLGEILALSESKGYCTAGRKHFADWLDCTLPNISYMLVKLEKMGYLFIQRTSGGTSKIVVNKALFYTHKPDLPVNGIDVGSKSHLPVPVNGIDGGSKWDLPKIQYKYNNKYNTKESEKNAFFKDHEKESGNHPFVEQKKEKTPPNSAPPPKKEKASYTDEDISKDIEPPVRTFFSELLNSEHWQKWRLHRKAKRQPFLLAMQEETAIRKLYKDCGGSSKVAAEMIEDSIANGWQGLFKRTAKNGSAFVNNASSIKNGEKQPF